ncbi:hypothetical protein LXL04_019345 [Taraxacum kok-saghyz]
MAKVHGIIDSSIKTPQMQKQKNVFYRALKKIIMEVDRYQRAIWYCVLPGPNLRMDQICKDICGILCYLVQKIKCKNCYWNKEEQKVFFLFKWSFGLLWGKMNKRQVFMTKSTVGQQLFLGKKGSSGIARDQQNCFMNNCIWIRINRKNCHQGNFWKAGLSCSGILLLLLISSWVQLLGWWWQGLFWAVQLLWVYSNWIRIVRKLSIQGYNRKNATARGCVGILLLLLFRKWVQMIRLVMLYFLNRFIKLLRVQSYFYCRGQFRNIKNWQILHHFGTMQLSLEFLIQLYRGCSWEEAAARGCWGILMLSRFTKGGQYGQFSVLKLIWQPLDFVHKNLSKVIKKMMLKMKSPGLIGKILIYIGFLDLFCNIFCLFSNHLLFLHIFLTNLQSSSMLSFLVFNQHFNILFGNWEFGIAYRLSPGYKNGALVIKSVVCPLIRGISRENTKVLVKPVKEFTNERVYTSNVVYREVLHDI